MKSHDFNLWVNEIHSFPKGEFLASNLYNGDSVKGYSRHNYSGHLYPIYSSWMIITFVKVVKKLYLFIRVTTFREIVALCEKNFKDAWEPINRLQGQWVGHLVIQFFCHIFSLLFILDFYPNGRNHL